MPGANTPEGYSNEERLREIGEQYAHDRLQEIWELWELYPHIRPDLEAEADKVWEWLDHKEET